MQVGWVLGRFGFLMSLTDVAFDVGGRDKMIRLDQVIRSFIPPQPLQILKIKTLCWRNCVSKQTRVQADIQFLLYSRAVAKTQEICNKAYLSSNRHITKVFFCKIGPICRNHSETHCRCCRSDSYKFNTSTIQIILPPGWCRQHICRARAVEILWKEYAHF